MSRFTFIDLFSGIGGFRIALENAGGICIAFSEIDKHAIKTYQNNFNTSNEIFLGDITKQKIFPNADIITGGVPCQAWSIAGKNKGFDDERGKLWFDTIRAVTQVKPKAFIFENVKGLSEPRNSKSLNLIISEFEKLNYKVFHKVLNTTDFGLPQNRKRLFIVGLRADLNNIHKFEFPSIKVRKSKLYEIFDNLNSKDDGLDSFFIFSDTRNGPTTIHSWDLIETTNEEKHICMIFLKNRRKSLYGNKDGNPLSFNQLKNLIPDLKVSLLNSLIEKNILKKTSNQKFDLVNSKNSSGINGIYRIFLPNSKIFSTLTATGTKDFIATTSIPKLPPNLYKEYFIKNVVQTGSFRTITSREAARLQGFPETFKIHTNHKHAIKQIGNAVPINVAKAVIDKIMEIA
jgi:DNA (cytosine-5)-methyltransferase 1